MSTSLDSSAMVVVLFVLFVVTSMIVLFVGWQEDSFVFSYGRKQSTPAVISRPSPIMTTAPTLNPFDFVLRTLESIAFTLHSVLGLTEPWTGCLRGAFGDHTNSLPVWFWPLAGIALLGVAVVNFSGNNTMILAAQAYVAAFHSGGVIYHLRLHHPPVTGCAPGVFVVMAMGIAALRVESLAWVLLGTILCVGVAMFLSWVLMAPPPPPEEASALMDEQSSRHTR